jgi:hypothetical protein
MTRRKLVALVTLFVALCTAIVTTTVAAAAAPMNSVLEVNVNRVCFFSYNDAYTCSVFRTDGTWLRDEVSVRGTWIVTAQAATVTEMNVDRVCHFSYSDAYMCSVFRTDGTWLRDEMTDNGVWIVTADATL